MNFIIENGHNTSYISTLFIALFYNESIIERCILLENNSPLNNGAYLQKLILHNFVKPIHNDACITSQLLNEIRLCAFALGWKNSNDIFEMCCEFPPFDFFHFLLQLINYYPMEIAMGTKVKHSSQIHITTPEKTLRLSYNKWAIKNTIKNVPFFVIFKIDNIMGIFDINKKIKLLTHSEKYNNVQWVFHSMVCESNNIHNVIINNHSELLLYNQQEYPNIRHIDMQQIYNITHGTIYIIYTKEPTI